MSDLLEPILSAIPESFFRRVEERMTDGAAVAHRQALRTPPQVPAHRMRLGTTRYFERAEALRLSAEDVGLSHRFAMVNTHAEILVTSGPVLITHAKVDHWGDPIEDKEYKLELACHNPGDGQQLALWEESDLDPGLLAVVVVQYAQPGVGQDETVPRRLGFGVPTRDLQGWHLLETLDALYAAYADRTGRVLDQARPVLKRRQDRIETKGQR
jgi:hypothetical protein